MYKPFATKAQQVTVLNHYQTFKNHKKIKSCGLKTSID